jgi:integrase
MRPRSKFDRMVLAEVLVEAGLTLIDEAENSPKLTDLARACQARNGLMVALLALCPIRRKNFASLELGRSFIQIHGRWWIVLSAAETKEKRPDERPIDELLTPAIDRYLGKHRPTLARTDNPPSALWLSSINGAPMSYVQVGIVIKATTLATVGIDVSPHLFRSAGPSQDGSSIRMEIYRHVAALQAPQARAANVLIRSAGSEHWRAPKQRPGVTFGSS